MKVTAARRAGVSSSAAISTGGNSEERFDAGLNQVEADADGKGAADIVFQVKGVTDGDQLTATDFLWL